MRPCEPAQSDPLGYLLTWTTYGTWLPGDKRWWAKRRRGFQPPDSVLESTARRRMAESKCLLDAEQRHLVEVAIADHCRIRNWILHAANCRSNHVHVVVTARVRPQIIQSQFKAWCSRRLKELEMSRAVNLSDQSPTLRSSWWSERGSRRFLNDERSLEAAIIYVRDAQECAR